VDRTDGLNLVEPEGRKEGGVLRDEKKSLKRAMTYD